MTIAKANSKERKQQIPDLWIIGMVSFLALGIVVLAMQNGMNGFAGDRSIPVVLRVLTIGLCTQFALSEPLIVNTMEKIIFVFYVQPS